MSKFKTLTFKYSEGQLYIISVNTITMLCSVPCPANNFKTTVGI